MREVTIYTDGGCEGNPGPGGWGAVMSSGKHHLEISGGHPATTNNRMEISAAIGALGRLKDPCRVIIYTDSQYLKDGITKWINGWKRKGWITSNKQPVKNVDLWKALDAATSRHEIEWRWVKGHAGNEGNERCDGLASGEIAKIKQQYTRAELKAMLKSQASQQGHEKAEDELL
jgi:ribonuclease HI